MKNSNLLVSDDAIFEIKSEQDKQKVLTYISADEWISPYIYECHALELPDAPLFFGQFKQDFMVEMPTGTYRVPPMENSDEELSETARDTGLILVYPEKGHLVAKPTRYTAFTTMCARAGISGSTICNSQKKPLLNVLPLAEKATWLSRGFSLHLAPCKILYRDGKVSSMLSAEYEVLPADMAVPAFEDRIKKDHPALELSAGMLSHEYLYLDYLLNNKEMEESFFYMLQDFGIKCDAIKAGVRFSTSDIGSSCMSAAPFYKIDDMVVRLGDPIVLSHERGHSIEQFIGKLGALGMLFKESEDAVEVLGNTKIKHPAGCFWHILDRNPALKAGSESIADALDATYPAGCTAIDVFLSLNQIIQDRNNKRTLSPTQLINLSETVAKLLLIDYTEYDKVWIED